MAARKDAEREAARGLREAGWALAEIATHLAVAKSSVSVWVRDVSRGGALPPGALPMPDLRPLPVWTSCRTRRCPRCERELPDVCFNRSRGGRQHWCRGCFRAYFRVRGDLHRAQSSRAKRARRERARAELLAFLQQSGCIDCGETDVVVLECDHVGMKSHTVSTLVADGAPLDVLRRELRECEVVCVNCHRRRTALRAGHVRGRADWREHLSAGTDVRSRNCLFLYSHLVAHGCADCGTRELVVLEFDHVADKRALVTRMATLGVSLAELAREIAACEVVCANCHRRRTTTRGGHYRLAARRARARTLPDAGR